MEILLNRRNKLFAALAAGALLLSACGDDDTKLRNIEKVNNEDGGFDITHEYEEGKRESVIDAELDRIYVSSFCDGDDLVEYYDGGRDGGPIRSAGHAACEDGKLTPEDFRLTK